MVVARRLVVSTRRRKASGRWSWPVGSIDRRAAATEGEEVLAIAAFPREHWRKIWSSNPLERLDTTFNRRARVVEILPDEAAVIRPVGAFLADTHDEWVVDERRCLSEASMAELHPCAPLTPSPPSKAVAGRHR